MNAIVNALAHVLAHHDVHRHAYLILGQAPSDAAAAVTLAVGDNVITVAVTAEDGSQQNYVITIHRASS